MFKIIMVAASFIGAAAAASVGHAHERWLLAPAEVAELSAHPLPELYSQVWPVVAVACVLAAALIALAALEARMSAVEARLAAPLARFAAGWGAVALRLGLAVMLGGAALGLLPRHDVAVGAEPTLFTPDLHLSLLGPGWAWLVGAQLGLALLLALGLATRFAAFGVLLLCLLGFGLFGRLFLSYGLHFAAPAVFLLAYGGGRLRLDDVVADWDEPAAREWRRLSASAAHPLPRAVMRWMAAGARRVDAAVAWIDSARRSIYPLVLFSSGATFVYLGVNFKLAQPTLLITILEHGGFPSFGLGYDALALIMTFVEISAGALLAMGVLVRPIAAFLIFAFTFMAVALGENIFFHANLYGLMALFVMAGRRAPERSDAPDPTASAIASALARLAAAALEGLNPARAGFAAATAAARPAWAWLRTTLDRMAAAVSGAWRALSRLPPTLSRPRP